VLDRLHASDPEVDVRQIAVVDATGRAAVHTGAACVREAGHRVGDGFSCQSSMMLVATVPDAMAAAYEAATGDLSERLLAALDAAEAEGGDVRGRQSATLLVVGRRKIDLRVDDHPDPLAELRRLHTLDRAYALCDDAETLVAQGRHEEAARLFDRVLELAPKSDELLFWAGLSTAAMGDVAGGAERVRAAAEINPRWIELLDRIEPETAPGAAEIRAALHQHERSRSG
jgi:tetratricopeptide (TPR) repeat protein